MAGESLLEAITAVQSLSLDEPIDSFIDSTRPRKRIKPTVNEIHADLEAKFLTPKPEFSTEWLNRLQSRWPDPPNPRDLMTLAPTLSRTVIRFTREGLEGRVTGYKEVTVPAHSATAKNSTSLLRKPASRADFVRGKAGFFPFAPGGLEGVNVTNVDDEDGGMAIGEGTERIGKDGLLQVAPGMRRGLALKEEKKEDEEVAKEEDFSFGDVKPKRVKKGIVETTKKEKKISELDTIDDLLPVEFPMLAPSAELALSVATKPKQREWAHMVDVNQELTNFHELVPNMAKTWPFELDTFQKEAVYHLENGDSVFVAAHTSAGKTVVAEYAIALAAKHMTKAIYTSPIKALSNQKFRDFRRIFDDVGILTGDVQINPEASCLIMTTEILRSMLYRGADLIRDVEFVIFDEVHYVNDLERGVVWEEVIIMLPDHVNLILLSATVPNTKEFASWVGRTKKKDIYVISTPKRPVPLEHYLWAGKQMFKIVDSNKKFLEAGWKAANDSLQGKKDPPQHAQQQHQQQQGNQRGGPVQRGQRGGRGGPPGRGGPNQRGGNPRGGGGRGSHQPGPSRGSGGGTFSRSGRGGMRTTAAQDKTIWVHLVGHLKKEQLLPAVIFVFSKRRCEENADALSNIDYCNQTEKSAIHMIIERSVARLKPDDRLLPQILRMRDLLSRGIAVHHGGLLPIVKEIVEILFAKTLVKVLFATETFAMGLNLPTRTVVFSGYRKHDGQSFRNLLPGEYTQMAGRAGRRGLDPVGTVIILSPMDEAPPPATLRHMILGDPTKLQSQFRLTYNMILNLLRVEALKIEEMIKRSFSENTTQTMLPEHEKEVIKSEKDLENLQLESCQICDVDMDIFHESCMTVGTLTQELVVSSLKTPGSRNVFVPRRFVVIQEEGKPRTVGIIATNLILSKQAPLVQVLTPVEESGGNKKGKDSEVVDLIPFHVTSRLVLPEQFKLREKAIPLTAIEVVSDYLSDVDLTKVRRGDRATTEQLAEELVMLSQNLDQWSEIDWKQCSKSLDFRELIQRRKDALSTAESCGVMVCPNLERHFANVHKKFLLQENINSLKRLISDQNLALLPDYEARIHVLQELGFIDSSSRVELKGRVACEINSGHELVLTELILDNVLAEYTPEECCALLSAFVFHEKTDSVPTLPANLEKGKKTIIDLTKKINTLQTVHQVPLTKEVDDFEARPRFGLAEVVFEWAKGMSFRQCTELTDVLEGSIVRVITRLDEVLREVRNAARVVGDPELYSKMEKAQECVRRDVCHCASLYL